MSTKMLKLVRNELSLSFSDICNTSFTEGIFPDKNKIAKVIPSHKKGPANDVNNYRPISLIFQLLIKSWRTDGCKIKYLLRTT